MSDSPRGKIHFLDHFDRLAIDATNYWTTNADAGGAAFAINEQHGGWVRGSCDTTDNDITNLFGPPIWKADQGGPLVLEIRLKPVTSVADGENFVGWTDDDGTDEVPITLSTTDVVTSNATNAVGFAYTGAGTANWKAVAVKADSDLTPVACYAGGRATTPVAATIQTFKIVLNKDGDADFYIDGRFQTRIDAAVTATTLLAPCVAFQGGGTARSVDVDYVYIGASHLSN